MIRSLFPQVDVRIAERAGAFKRAARDADIVFIARKCARSIVLDTRRLKWLHLGGTGIDRLLPLSDLDPEIVMTHSRGLNAEMMGDYVVCVILMLMWGFPRLILNQSERLWERRAADRAEGKTLAVARLGNIGRAVARRARVTGMRVIGVKRSPPSVPGVERVAGWDDLDEILAEADSVVLVVPLTGQTRGMIGLRQFQAVKESAYLINICRGAVVQGHAFIKALQDGRIAGAALDVFDNEPLPPRW